MTKKNFVTMETETTLSQLSPELASLCRSSLDARLSAYAPYSNFKVGAAIKCSGPNGEVVTGCNVENASYGLAICAERTALVKAVSQGLTSFSAIAISADLPSTFVGPCGACRQFMCEFNPSLPIYLVKASDETVQVTSLAKLLPDCFSPKTMELTFKCSNGTTD